MTPARGPKVALAFAGLFLSAAALMFFLSAREAVELRQFLARSQVTEGEVIRHAGGRRSPARRLRGVRLEFAYLDAAGARHEVRSEARYSRGDYAIGARVPIRIDPTGHTRAEPDRVWPLWSGIVALCGTGIAFTVVGVLVLRAAFARKEPA